MRQQRHLSDQITRILAMVMAVALASAALATGSQAYVYHRIAQNTADAAAVAASQKLAQLCSRVPASNDWTQVRDTVKLFVMLNDRALGQENNGEQAGSEASYKIYYINSAGNRLYGDLTIEGSRIIPCGNNNGPLLGYRATGIEVVVDKHFRSLVDLIGQGQLTASGSAKANYGLTLPTLANESNARDTDLIARVRLSTLP